MTFSLMMWFDMSWYVSFMRKCLRTHGTFEAGFIKNWFRLVCNDTSKEVTRLAYWSILDMPASQEFNILSSFNQTYLIVPKLVFQPLRLSVHIFKHMSVLLSLIMLQVSDALLACYWARKSQATVVTIWESIKPRLCSKVQLFKISWQMLI